MRIIAPLVFAAVLAASAVPADAQAIIKVNDDVHFHCRNGVTFAEAIKNPACHPRHDPGRR